SAAEPQPKRDHRRDRRDRGDKGGPRADRKSEPANGLENRARRTRFSKLARHPAQGANSVRVSLTAWPSATCDAIQAASLTPTDWNSWFEAQSTAAYKRASEARRSGGSRSSQETGSKAPAVSGGADRVNRLQIQHRDPIPLRRQPVGLGAGDSPRQPFAWQLGQVIAQPPQGVCLRRLAQGFGRRPMPVGRPEATAARQE